MTDLLTTIAVVVVANGGLAAFFAYVFKQLFERTLDSAFEKKLKVYQHELDLKAEAYKREIELVNQKTLHSYSRLFDEQAGVIKEVYSDLISIYRKTSYLIYHLNLLETAPELFENRKIPNDGDPVKWEWYLKETMSESQEDILSKGPL